jgi:AAA domain
MMEQARDLFAELEARSTGEWKHLLVSEPELLDTRQTQPQRIIHAWDEIPDAMMMAAPKIEWVAEGIIPRASVTLMAGEPGSYKSWLALTLLRSAVLGGKFLGRECQPTCVLYLDRENPLSVVRERLAMLGIESLGSAKIWGGWLHDAPPAIGDARLLQIAHERKPLLIFDSLIRFHSADENSATEMAQVMGDLRALANAGATVVVLHHRAKSESSRYRGSSDIAGGVDTAFSVSRDRQAGILKLECFKSRFLEEFSMTLRPDLAGAGDFVVTEAPEVSAARDFAERLTQAIRDKPGRTQSELLDASKLAKGKARAVLAEFDGQLWRSERGAHNAKRFFPLEVVATVEIEV